MEISDGNKIIMDFLGKEYIHWTFESRTSWISVRKTLDNNVYKAFDQYKDLKYHKSFSWIMPVFERIQYIADNQSEFLKEYYNFDFKIDLLNGVDLRIDKHRIFMQTAFGEGQLIDALYNGVLSFIEWYNINKL